MAAINVCKADNLEYFLDNEVPGSLDVKESLQPPEGHRLYDVWYGKGNRFYQCNPEKDGFERWYNVQTHTFLYATKGKSAPYDIEGTEIGQLSIAPLNITQGQQQQKSDPMDIYSTFYYLPDGSWTSSARPLSTTSREKDRAERGDKDNLDDHLTKTLFSSSEGYLSHAKYIVRLNTLDGARPDNNACTEKGMVVNKPFTAYYMLYTDQPNAESLQREQSSWKALVDKYSPDH
ncbi:hypothetical protein BJ944DRAFT_167332 [Cunninghamella echinulata]|nr:hypothetical protein BJ944DRAFT_167332 [Cunninghamella echinulata]